MSTPKEDKRRVLNLGDIEGLPQRERARLINSISGFKSANIVATANSEGETACCIVSSVVHLGSNPALMGVVFRPPGADAHNYQNLSVFGLFHPQPCDCRNVYSGPPNKCPLCRGGV